MAPTELSSFGRDGSTNPALAVRGLTKIYGGTAALSGADLTVAAGEFHALLGENGAGKSTLVKVVAGLERADRGSISILGTELPPGHGPEEVARLGCAFIHQDLGLIDEFNIAENIALTVGYPRRRGRIDWCGVMENGRQALDRLGVRDLDLNRPVGELTVPERAIAAIARALALQANLIVLDEPTAQLDPSEASALFDVLDRLRRSDVACIMITHRLEEALERCDRVTVMRNGRTVASEQTAALDRHSVVELMLGGARTTMTTNRTLPSQVPTRLRVDRLVTGSVGPVSFSVRAGEVLAITGLADAGHDLLGKAIYGVERTTSGRILLGDEPYEPRSPSHARRRGLAYVPADRRLAVAPFLSARENLFLNPERRPLVREGTRSERQRAETLMRAFGVRPPDPERQLVTFSGGNQQKVVLAKWLSRNPLVLILEAPTVAVDVGARVDVFDHVRRACDSGIAILLISSDFEEIANLADRVLILRRGSICAEMEAPALTTDSVTRRVLQPQDAA